MIYILTSLLFITGNLFGSIEDAYNLCELRKDIAEECKRAANSVDDTLNYQYYLGMFDAYSDCLRILEQDEPYNKKAPNAFFYMVNGKWFLETAGHIYIIDNFTHYPNCWCGRID